jgi:hypothetical protein
MIEIQPRLDDPNLSMLELVVQALGDVCDSLVFIGGCATALLVTMRRSQQIRVTEDVDVIAEAASIRDYHSVEESCLPADSSLTDRPMHRSAFPVAASSAWFSLRSS